MNENIDLTEILRNCPEGWLFYSSTVGHVTFVELDLENPEYPITVRVEGRGIFSFTKEGWYLKGYPDGECILFPSKDQRDWSKFTAPWYKKEKFDPKTLQPFDKVLVRDEGGVWDCDFFSYKRNRDVHHPYVTIASCCDLCIPYNDDTKHLVGTTDEAPEYYKYWED